MTPFQSQVVAAKFESYPPEARKPLLALRELVFDTARSLAGVAAIEETLKWGEPAYLTTNKSGTTIRIDWKPKYPERYSVYCHCQTQLIETFRALFPEDFEFEGNRGMHMGLDAPMPTDALRVCIEAALTYHLKRSQPKASRYTSSL